MEATTHRQTCATAMAARAGGPFDLGDEAAYRRWRDAKLAEYPSSASDLVVEIADLGGPTSAERAAIADLCRRANMAIYTCPGAASEGPRLRQELRAFAAAFGLRRLEGHRSAAADGLVALEIAGDDGRNGYIPYTDRPLSWHTDGYYNGTEDRIRAFVLHCVRSAEEGGENGLLDPEIAYIRLRDENPAFVAALAHPEAMTIPANVESDGAVRATSTGPILSVDRDTGALHMRYTARGRNVAWRGDSDTRAAADFLRDLLGGDDPLLFRHRLRPGQGVICNNVLHCRTGFHNGSGTRDAAGRLLYRIRYLDRVSIVAPVTNSNHRRRREGHGPTQ